MIPLKIRGSGIYRPKQLLLSSDLDKIMSKDIGWTERNFGIISRGVADKNETSSYMAAEASKIALKNAGWNAHDLDVIVGACAVMEQPIPSTSVLIQHKLGLGNSGISTFDINLTCLSFLSAFDVVSMGIACGNWKKALIVSSDIASVGLDYTVPQTACLFGDGAAAVCVEAIPAPNASGILARRFETYGNAHAVGAVRAGGTKLRVEEGFDALVKGSRFEMNAFEIFKAGAKCLPTLTDRVLHDGGLTRDTVDLVVCHQASSSAIKHVRRMFPSNPDKVVNIFPTFGNQVAASLPTALSYALENRLAQPGDHLLLLGVAAGVSAGAIVLRL